MPPTPLHSAATPRLVLYDLDGTLLDSFDDIADALNHGLAALGLPTHPLEVVKSFVGDGIGVLVRKALGEAGAGRYEELLPIVRDYYLAHPVGRSRLYPGAEEALRALRAMGALQAVLTNKPHPIALDSCERVGLTPLVDRVQGEDETHPLKPNPAAALGVARELGADVGACVIVGDGQADADLARAAGIPFIGCVWGVNPRERIETMNPAAVIESLAELPGLLRNWGARA